MATLENFGLRVAELSDVDGLAAELARTPAERPHVVRLEVADGAALHDPGLVVRPTWIHWVCGITDGAADLMGKQSKQQRYRTRNALRAMASLTMEVTDPMAADRYDEWLPLYTAQVETMRNGVDMATRNRARVIAPGSRHLLVGWRRAGRLVCGCVVRIDPDAAALVTRFSAVATDEQDQELARGMYMALADLAAARGLRWFSLGNDVNFYGSVVMPGLCAYKLRLGFRPVPADLFGNRSCRTVAERVTSVAGLELPVLRWEYRQPREPSATVEDFVDGAATLRLTSVIPAGETNAVLESLPEHRRFVLD